MDRHLSRRINQSALSDPELERAHVGQQRAEQQLELEPEQPRARRSVSARELLACAPTAEQVERGARGLCGAVGAQRTARKESTDGQRRAECTHQILEH